MSTPDTPPTSVPSTPTTDTAGAGGGGAITTDTPRPGGTGIRASDAEREQVVEILHRALGEGRLDLDETDTRVAAAYATAYRGELPSLIADLPDGMSPVTAGARGDAPASWQELWVQLVWRVRVGVWGRAAAPSPTAAQQRVAGLLVVLAVVWVALCALAGAVLAAS
jgi:hypothetical protein